MCNLIGGCYGWLLWVVAMGGCCLLGADLCLQSDVMTDAHVQGKAAPPIAAMHALLKNEVETLTKAALGELAGAADGPATKRART